MSLGGWEKRRRISPPGSGGGLRGGSRGGVQEASAADMLFFKFIRFLKEGSLGTGGQGEGSRGVRGRGPGGSRGL